MAEDDEDDILLFASAVGDICPDIKLTVQRNGQELIDSLQSMPTPGAIFLDLNMPKKKRERVFKRDQGAIQIQ